MSRRREGASGAGWLNGLSLPSGRSRRGRRRGDLWRDGDHGKHGEEERKEEQRKEGGAMCPIPQLPYSEQNWRRRRLTRHRACLVIKRERDKMASNSGADSEKCNMSPHVVTFLEWFVGHQVVGIMPTSQCLVQDRQTYATSARIAPTRAATTSACQLAAAAREFHLWSPPSPSVSPLNPCKKRLRSAIKIAALSLSPFCKRGILITRRAVLFLSARFSQQL